MIKKALSGSAIRLCIISSLISISTGLSAQSLFIGHQTLKFSDPARGNRKVKAEVFFPSLTGNNRAGLSEIVHGRFPVICFGHGYQLSWRSYEYLIDALVPRGYIILFPQSETRMFPSHDGLGMDMVFLTEKIIEAGKDQSSSFYGRIDSMNCVMGHSMGGGCAVLAASRSETIKSLAVLAPYDTDPSASEAATGVSVPSLIFSGSNDCITPPEKHQIPIFNNLAGSRNALITISGANHCQMADRKFLCKLGEATCKPDASISFEEQHRIILRYLVLWLDYTLKGDDDSGREFESAAREDQSVKFTVN